jgi:hypothetical protein
MTYETNDRCACLHCPGNTCNCGCQSAALPAPMNVAGATCQCGPACGCESAEQGCLCRK